MTTSYPPMASAAPRGAAASVSDSFPAVDQSLLARARALETVIREHAEITEHERPLPRP
ncbi:MAG: hypothetical protein IRY91_09215, partial [Gemmatimonadaceae bacterium]|nr:hypothetical protein [Gemmatimonadaceae bacterium]